MYDINDVGELNFLFKTSVLPNIDLATMNIVRRYTLDSSCLSNYMINKKKFHDCGENYNIRNYNKIISVLRKTIDLCRIQKPLTVYHGTNKRIIENMPIDMYVKNNMFIKTIPFLSTSLDEDIATRLGYVHINRFLRNNGLNNKEVVLQIELPENYPALWTYCVSAQENELELILKNGIKFKIDDYEEEDKKTKIYVKPIKTRW